MTQINLVQTLPLYFPKMHSNIISIIIIIIIIIYSVSEFPASENFAYIRKQRLVAQHL
jgi:hypothetical protein